MAGSPENQSLREALEADDSFKARGLTATCGPTGSVVVDYRNHVRGIWHFHAGHYFWMDIGYAQPSFRTESIRKAIDHTLDSA